MYYSGKGCIKDDTKAIACFQKAADLGMFVVAYFATVSLSRISFGLYVVGICLSTVAKSKGFRDGKL
jgi:hypothetical protein